MRKLAGSLLLVVLLSGCVADASKGLGVSPWPLYRQLATTKELSDKEKKVIKDCLTTEQLDRVKEIVAAEAYYRTIVETHNKKAMEQREKAQKLLGTDEEDLVMLRRNWTARTQPRERP